MLQGVEIIHPDGTSIKIQQMSPEDLPGVSNYLRTEPATQRVTPPQSELPTLNFRSGAEFAAACEAQGVSYRELGRVLGRTTQRIKQYTDSKNLRLESVKLLKEGVEQVLSSRDTQIRSY